MWRPWQGGNWSLTLHSNYIDYVKYCGLHYNKISIVKRLWILLWVHTSYQPTLKNIACLKNKQWYFPQILLAFHKETLYLAELLVVFSTYTNCCVLVLRHLGAFTMQRWTTSTFKKHLYVNILYFLPRFLGIGSESEVF